MKRNMLFRSTLVRSVTALLALVAHALLGSCANAQGTAGERNVVTISLLPGATIDDSVIYLDQIAKLSGGSMSLRQRLARLDVAEFKLSAERAIVSSDQVRFRLLFAGIGENLFHLTGAKRTIVSESDDPVTARKILAAADRTMRSKFPNAGIPKDIIAPLLDLRASDSVQFEVKTPHAKGNRVDVAILVNGKTREVVPVTYEAPAKAQFSKNDSVRTGFVTEPIFGAAKDKGAFLVKSRDRVRIVAQIGSAQIVAIGEAEQDGRLGDIIRVRNIDSNRVVSARVDSIGVVLADQ